MAQAKPKRLRFKLLNVAGEVIHHARMLFVRVWGTLEEGIALLQQARLRLRQLALALASTASTA